ncbi:MAG: hypothetical protein WAL35_03875 [Acidimicrobiales bacterium]
MTTRSMIDARSNSANTPSICIIIRPEGVVVSKGSVAERKPTPEESRRERTSARRPTERQRRSTR